MNKLKIFLHPYKDILFLFFLSLVPLLWYGLDNNQMVTSNDVGYPFNPVEFFKNRLFVWDSALNFGTSQREMSGTIIYHALEAFLTTITGSIFTGQKIYVILWFFLPMLVMYIAVKKISIFSTKPYMALLAAILFQFNYFQITGWRVLWRARFSLYIALPLVFVLLVDYFEGRRKLFKTAIIFGLVLLVFNGGGSPPVFGALLLLFFTVIIYYLLINFPRNFVATVKKFLALIIISLVTSFVFSAFWTIPYLQFAGKTYGTAIEFLGGTTSGILWTDMVSRNASVLNLLRLQGLDLLELQAVPNYINIILKNPLLILGSFILPMLSFASLLLAKQALEKKYIILLSLLAIVGLIFSAGSHEPFRAFYLFLLKTIPGFPIFRTPIYKFGSLLWFAYAFLIAFSLSCLIEKLKNRLRERNLPSLKFLRISSVLFIILILALDFPMFNSNFFIWNAPLTTLEKVPSYVFEAGRYFDTHNNFSSRTLVLPDLNTTWHADTFKWNYFSLNTVNFLLTRKNFLSNDVELQPKETLLINGLYDLLKKNDPVWKNLAWFLGVDSLLLRRDTFFDIAWVPSTNPLTFEKILSSEKVVKKRKSFGQWDYYQVDLFPVEKFFLPQNIVLSTTSEEDSLNLFFFLDSIGYKPEPGFIFSSSPLANFSDRNMVVIPGPMPILLPVNQEEFSLFKPKILPTSLLYFLVEAKEKELRQKTTSRQDLVNLNLGFSLKRLAELDGLIGANVDVQDSLNVLGRYSVLLSEIHKNLVFLKEEKKDIGSLLLRARKILSNEQNFFAKLVNEQKNPLLKKSLENTYRATGDILRSLGFSAANDPLPDLEKGSLDKDTILLTSNYKWETPEAGRYEIYIDSSSILANSKRLVLEIGERSIVGEPEIVEGNEPKTHSWQKIGEVDLAEGEQALKITADDIPVYSFKKGDIIVYKVQSSKFKVQKTEVKVNYTRLNPTRYKVEINNASEPFTLVFNEGFDKDWKLYKIKNQKSKIKNGDIIDEILPTLNENIFNTLRQKPLPEKNHFKVNGYANGWRVDTENRRGKVEDGKEYEIIIEYWPQRLLWLGLGLSGISMLGSIIYLVVSRKKE